VGGSSDPPGRASESESAACAFAASLWPSGSQRPPPSTFCPPDPASHTSTITTNTKTPTPPPPPLTKPPRPVVSLFLLPLCNRSVLVPPSRFCNTVPQYTVPASRPPCSLLPASSEPAYPRRLQPARKKHRRHCKHIHHNSRHPPRPRLYLCYCRRCRVISLTHSRNPLTLALDSTRIPQLARLRHHHTARPLTPTLSHSPHPSHRIAYPLVRRIRQQ
jgi:hypothetical protein